MEKTLQEQAKIVKERLRYHFGSVDGGYNTPKQLPFMLEFLGEVNRLCALAESSNEMSNCIKPAVINCVPYQTCPKCGGDGNLLRYNSPALLGMNVPICDVCDGKKIIPMAHYL